ncbi:hypothetical protein SUGI_0000400 [Cryptomeria japonica]|nr:hypothetical protein SUGI_0000400 [Cryptomeria japonica]
MLDGITEQTQLNNPTPPDGLLVITAVRFDHATSMAKGDTKSKTPSLGQSLIPAISKLQDILSRLGSDSVIDLPQLAVVGSQSSGKTSVLEALVGRDFLPRGSDICTRRPLVLQLVQIPLPEDDELDYEEWGEFSHLPGQRFTDFSTIRHEIQIETEREAGANKGISDKQIRLIFFSPYVLNINLVDLPGIMKVPVGDQPIDIESRTRAMIMSYIEHPSCIILAVSPANSDLANSDALHIARVADADGSRTIGVITKLDVLDRGTDACNFLRGNVIPLRLGYIGVVNQSEQDMFVNPSIRDALAYEKNFFYDHPVYHGLADQCGIPQLAKKLNQILAKHVKLMLPDLRAKIHAQMISVKKELASYGQVAKSDIDQGSLILNILREFSDAFTSSIEGKHEEMTFELVGGARIHYIIQSVFVKRLEDVDPCEDISDKDIQTAIQNATGSRGALFVPEVPFQVLLRRKIAQLLDPSYQCVHIIYQELVKLANKCQTRDLLRLPVLQRHLEEVLGTCLHKGLTSALRMVEHIIEMEMDYINTSHHAFIGGSKAMAAARQQQWSPVASVPTPKTKENADFNQLPATDKVQKLPAILARASPSRFITNHVRWHNKFGANGYAFRGGWGISSIFELGEPIASVDDREGIPLANDGEEIPYANDWEAISSANGQDSSLSTNDEQAIPLASGREGIISANDNSSIFPNGNHATNFEPVDNVEPIRVSSIIQLKEPPAVLKFTEAHTANLAIGIAVTKILLRSYYDIVRKNIQDRVPKAIMHFLVNNVKRELHSVLIKELYREELFAKMLEERDDIAVKRKQFKNILQVLQQAVCTLDDLSLD